MTPPSPGPQDVGSTSTSRRRTRRRGCRRRPTSDRGPELPNIPLLDASPADRRRRQADLARLDPRRHLPARDRRRASCSSRSPHGAPAKWASAVFMADLAAAVRQLGAVPPLQLEPDAPRRSSSASTTRTSSCSSPAPTRRSRCCALPPDKGVLLLVARLGAARCSASASGCSGSARRAGCTCRSTSRSAGRP